MKKLFALSLSMVMAFSMSLTCMAANSSSASSAASQAATVQAVENTTVSDASGNTVAVAGGATQVADVAVSEGNVSVAAPSNDDVATIKTGVSSSFSSINVVIRKIMNISAPAGYVPGTTVWITIVVPGLDTSKNISVMHNTTIIPCTVNGNTVRFETNGFSPFAIVETDKPAWTSEQQAEHELILAQWQANQLAAKAAEAQAAQAAQAAPVSPKTGDTTFILVVTLIAAAALTALIVGRKFLSK